MRLNTNSITTRILSGFLSVLMVVSAVPTTGYAADLTTESSVLESSNTTTMVVDEDGIHTEDETTKDNVVVSTDVQSTTEVSDTSDNAENTVVTEENADSSNVSPVYNYSIALPEDTTISETTYTVTADVVSTATNGTETSNVDYSVEFSVNNENAVVTNVDQNSASITFNLPGEYTVVSKLIVNGEEVASDEMNISVEEAKETDEVLFDHYYNDIDESFVSTSDLLVITNDASIFTKNTNVVSNFDNAYIISCGSVEEARFVYSYYVDKVDSISDLSQVISVATDEDESSNEISEESNEDVLSQLTDAVAETKDVDYSEYIALIDSGANADVNFSVVGEDTSDTNGHGTKMLELIKAQNPNAKVMSIKAFNDRTTDAASIYAAIKLAIENNVKIINLSLVAAEVNKNSIVKDVIQEALDHGITIIGAAGNYNMSATKFIPGSVDGVITIGACDANGNKIANSNYDVDYYVVAESTSEATAIYTGLFSAGITSDEKIFTSDLSSTVTTDPYDVENTDFESEEEKVAALIANVYHTSYFKNDEGHWEVVLPTEETYELSASASVTEKGNRQDLDLHSVSVGATSSGTCSYSAGSPGEGSASNFSGGGIFEAIANNGGVYVSCDAEWGNSTDSLYAKVLSGSSVSYKSTVTGVDRNYDGGSKTLVTYDVLLTNDNFNARTWTSVKDTYKTIITKLVDGKVKTTKNGKQYVSYSYTALYVIYKNGSELNRGDVTVNNTGFILEGTASEAARKSAESTARANAFAKIADVNIVEQKAFGGNKNVSNLVNTYMGDKQATWEQTYQHTNQNQVYRGRVTAWKWNYVYLRINKNIDSRYTDLYNTGAYPINTNTIRAYYNGSPVYDINGNQVVFTPGSNGAGQTFTLDYSTYYGKTITLRESVGNTYLAVSPVNVTVTSYDASNPSTGTITNKLKHDPIRFYLRKVSDKTGLVGKYNADTHPANAYFQVNYYTDPGRTNLVRSWKLKSDANGSVNFTNIAYLAEGTPFYNPVNPNAMTMPIGYYTITEVQSPTNGSYHTGLYTNGAPYYMSLTGTGSTDDWLGILTDSNGTEIARYTKDTITFNTNYKGTIGGLTDTTSWYQVEEESWRPIGLVKADFDMNQLGYADSSLKIAEGSATYDGAVYQLFSKTTKSTADMFTATYNNPNSGTLSFGTNNTISATNGDGTTFSYTATGAKPVLFNGNPIYVTVNNGYADTGSIKLPFDSDYVFYEVTAPVGYLVNTTPSAVAEADWLTTNANATHTTLTDYSGVAHDVVKVTEVSSRDGSANNSVLRYGFALYKKDSTSSVDTLDNAQGDGSLNGIRFAVINRSTNHVVMRNQYNTVDTSYVAIKDGVEIGANQICAILTTHTHNGQEGYISMYGLPYGKYEIVELKRDAGTDAALIGSAYTSQGSSTYANNSYMWHNNDFTIDYTTDANKTYKGVDGISHFTWSYVNKDADHIAMNKEFVDGFQGYKMDEEYLAVTEGDSNANDVRFAVINRSAKSVEILKSDMDTLAQVDPNFASYIDYNASVQVAPGNVVAVLTTHDGPTTTAVSDGTVNEGTHTNEAVDGYFAIYGLPYGTYEVVELRRDAVVNPGDVWANTNKGTSIYANDSFYWKNYSYTYSLTDTADAGAHNDVRSALTKHNSPYATTSTNQYQNQVFRDGFSFWKRDLTYNKVTDHPQGDASFNDIRYAVVNVSDDNVKMFDKYTNMLPTVDRPYVSILNNVPIEPGKVCAIVTSHNKSGTELNNGNLQGYVALFGLPYGQYEIHELRADATIEVGDTYEGSAKLGTSIYANHNDNSSAVTDTNGSRSMLWNDTMFSYNLTDTADGVHAVVNDVNHVHQQDNNNDGVWENDTTHGSIKIVKYDNETGLSDKDAQQGSNSLAGIQFAIVNRSKWAVSYPYDTTDADQMYFEPGEVIAIAETDENGEVVLPHVSYGTYDVYELRIAQSKNKDTTTKGHTVTPHHVFDEEAYKNGTKPDIYGNDDRANDSYTWNESITNVSVTNYTSHTVNVDYTVTPQKGRTIRTNDQENLYNWSDLPIRSDFYTVKVDIDGKRMGYMPFLVSLVKTDEDGYPIQKDDGTYDVIEEHIIVSNERGEINTRDWTTRPKTADNVNQLDGLYNGVDFTGTKEQLKAAATQNIWFGSLDGINNIRGSLLKGTYVIQELRRSEAYGYGVEDEESYYDNQHVLRTVRWNTEMYDMISSKMYVVHDNIVYDPADFDIPVNIPIYVKSEALDNSTRTNTTTPSLTASLRDTAMFGNLNGSQKYGYITNIWRVQPDGTTSLLKEGDMVVMDFSGEPEMIDGKAYSTIKNADGTTTVVQNANTLEYFDGNFRVIKKPTHTDPNFNVLHDINVVQNFELDTTSCEEGDRIAFSVELYRSVGDNGWAMVKSHNRDLDEPTQDVGVTSFFTHATNKTTGTRVGSLAGYDYSKEDSNLPLVPVETHAYNDNGIVGFTIADDEVFYTSLADDHNYHVSVDMVDDSGNVITDIYGNKCDSGYFNLYIDNSLTEVVHGTDLMNPSKTEILQRSFTGPSSGSIKFSDIGMSDHVLPNGTNVYFRVYLTSGDNVTMKEHNVNLDVEDETIRWMNLSTTAMSEEGVQGIITNGKHYDYVSDSYSILDNDAILRDNIHYSNLAEAVNVRVEGYVYLVGYNADGSRFIDYDNGTNNKYVAHESKTFNLTDVPSGDIEMQYTIKNSGQYSGRQLVVTERIYMDVAGKCEQQDVYVDRYDRGAGQYITDELHNVQYVMTDDDPTEVLIAVHENINDQSQTVSVPNITGTKLTSSYNSNSYKIVSRELAEVTLNDKVSYQGLKANTSWNLTAELYKEDELTNVPTPVLDAEGNPVVATIDFTPNSSTGEVNVPITFTQTISDLDWDDTQSWVCYETLRHGTTDVVYARHNNIFDRDETIYLPTLKTQISSEYDGHKQEIMAQKDQKVTDTVSIKNLSVDVNTPNVFTLKMEALNTTTGDPVLDANGNPYVATKTYTLTTDGKNLFIDGVKSNAKLITGKSTVADPTGKFGTSLPESTTRVFGNDANPVDLKIDMNLDATGMLHDSIVFAETLYFGNSATDGNEVMVEDDITNADQTVYVAVDPKIVETHLTSSKFKESDYKISTLEKGSYIVDKVLYDDLLPDVYYVMKGTLKVDGKDVENGTVETVFKASSTGTGEVYVEFKDVRLDNGTVIDPNTIAGKALVAYQELYYVGTDPNAKHLASVLARHGSEDNLDETVYVPHIETQISRNGVQSKYKDHVTDPKDWDNNATLVELDGTKTDAVTITDTVKYTNLIKGKKYKVVGTLMYRDSLAEAGDKEQRVTTNLSDLSNEKYWLPESEVEFTAEDTSGSVDVEFSLDASIQAGKVIVAYEDIYMIEENDEGETEEILVAQHHDLNDACQGFTTSLLLHVKLTKSDFSDKQYALKNAEITIYRDKDCTQVLTDINGNPCIGTTNENGSVEFVIVTNDASMEFYAKETKAPFGYKTYKLPMKVTPTTSRESVGVCPIDMKMLDKIIIVPSKRRRTGRTGDETPIALLLVMLLVGIISMVSFFATKKKKTSDKSEDSVKNDSDSLTSQNTDESNLKKLE